MFYTQLEVFLKILNELYAPPIFVSPQSRESEQKVDCVFKHIRQVGQNRELHLAAHNCYPTAILLPDASLRSMNKTSRHSGVLFASIRSFIQCVHSAQVSLTEYIEGRCPDHPTMFSSAISLYLAFHL